MIGNEFRRLFRNRTTWLVIVVILVLQVVLLYKIEIGKEYYEPNRMKSAWKDVVLRLQEESPETVTAEWEMRATEVDCLDMIQSDPSAENVSFMQGFYQGNLNELVRKYESGSYYLYTESPHSEYFLARDILEQLSVKNSQKNYRKNLLENADKMRRVSVLFQEDSFNVRDYELTYSIYSNLPNFSISDDMYRAETRLFSGSVAYVICLVLAFFLCVELFLEEKDEGTLRVTRTCCNGRKKFGYCKMAVLSLSVLGMMLLLYAVRLLVLANHYGLDNWNASVQSIPGCEGCIFSLRVWQYFLFIFLFRYLGVMACTCLIAFFCVLCRNTFFSIGLGAFLMLSQVVLYTTVNQRMGLSVFHFVNLWANLRFDPIVFYINLRFFGLPIPALPVMLLFTLAVAVVFYFLTVRKYGECAAEEKGGGRRRISLLTPKTTSVTLWETGRILWGKKVLLILVAFAVIRGSILIPQIGYDSTDTYYKKYMKQLEGELTEEKEEFISSEELRFADLRQQKMTAKIHAELVKENGFHKTQKRMEHLKKIGKGEFFWDKPFLVLFGEKSLDRKMNRKLLLTALCLLIFTETMIFADDSQKGVLQLLFTAQKRKKAVHCRMFIGFLLAVFAWFAVYAPYMRTVFQKFGAEGFQKPVCSMIGFEKLGMLSVGCYLALTYLGKLLAFLTAAAVIHYLALKTRSVSLTLSCGLIIFVAPLLLCMSDSRIEVIYTPFRLFLSEELYSLPIIVQGGYVVAYLAALILLYRKITRKMLRVV